MPQDGPAGTDSAPAEFDWEGRIRARAAECGIDLVDPLPAALASHAVWVLRANADLHLTAITAPEEFLDRHLGEAFEGAAMLDPSIEGQALDLGSGNGYPGLPLVAARSRLRVLLAEASRKKALFLRQVLQETGLARVAVLEAQIQRAADLGELELGPFRVVTSRAMGGWAKILPRLASVLEPDGELLVWAGADVLTIVKRVVWRKFEIVERRPLPRREQSWVWRFRRVQP